MNELNGYNNMIYDVVNEMSVEKDPNPETERFYQLLEAYNQSI